MKKRLLIEIGVEELPAVPLLKELDNIQSKWQRVLDEYHLQSEFEFYYTPRRLTLLHEAFSDRQDDSTEFTLACEFLPKFTLEFALAEFACKFLLEFTFK